MANTGTQTDPMNADLETPKSIQKAGTSPMKGGGDSDYQVESLKTQMAIMEKKLEGVNQLKKELN